MEAEDGAPSAPPAEHEPPPPPPRRSTWAEGFASRGIGAPGGELEDYLLQRAGLTLLFLLILSYKVLSAAHLSARFVNGESPEYEVEEIPGILWRFIHDPTRPGEAFAPVNYGGEVPNTWHFWAALAAILVVHVGGGWILYKWIKRRRRGRGGGVPGAYVEPWAVESEFRELLHQSEDGAGDRAGIVVGTHGGKQVAIEPLHSLMLLGPPRSGKSGSVSVPAILTWDGPVLVATTRGRTVDETIGWRETQGRVRVFDPAAHTRYERSGWALLSFCGHWEGAIHMAQHLVSAARGSAGGSIGGGPSDPLDRTSLWSGSMAMALAPYLYAAAGTGRSILQVARWVEREERDEVMQLLMSMDEDAAQALDTAMYRNDADRANFFHHMYQLLGVYSDPVVSASATKSDIEPEDLLTGRKNTLYLTAPEHDQSRFQPLFATIVRQVLASVNDRYAVSGRSLHPPLLVIVDGAVGVGSLQLLSRMSSTGMDKGVEVISIFNDTDWYRAMEGSATETLINNHRALLVLQRGTMGESTTPAAEKWAEVGHELEPGEAALLYEDRKPIRVQLRNWREDGRLTQRVEAPQDALPKRDADEERGNTPISHVPDYTLIDDGAGWRRRGKRKDEGQVISAPNGTTRRRPTRGNVFQAGDSAAEETAAAMDDALSRRRRSYRPTDQG